MELRYLSSFYEVAKRASFSEAADHLEVSKGLVSRHIRQLEKQLNTQLLMRSTRKVYLTEAGRHLFSKAQQIFLLADSAEQQIQDLAQSKEGKIRFTAPAELGIRVIEALLPDFQQQCPGVELDVNLSTTKQVIEHGEHDIALRTTESLSDDLVVKPLGTLKNVLVASPGYLEGKPTVHSVKDLLNMESIVHNRSPDWCCWHLIGDNEQLTVEVRPKMSISHYAGIKRMVINHYGVASLPIFEVENELREGVLVQLLPSHHLATHALCVAHAPHRLMPEKMRIFKRLLVTYFEHHSQYLV